MTGIERLRKLESFFEHLSGLVHYGGEPLCDVLHSIASQIEREQDATVADSPYDALPPDDRAAIAWVRDHGGVEHVRNQWDYLRGRANHADHVDRQLARRQRQIDESHEALRRRNERIGFLVSELNRANRENHEMFMRRAGDYTAFADEVCKRLASELRYVEGCSKDVMDAALHALDRRLMPEGMEWPRVDGKPVVIGERLVGYGSGDDGYEVVGVRPTCGWVLVKSRDHITRDGGPVILEWDASKCHRPTPKVLDADGAEIEVGDDLYSVEGMLKFHVSAIDKKSGRIATEAMFALDKWADPKMFTHRAPVLAADGKPLREGDTVWYRDHIDPLEVRGISTTESGAQYVKAYNDYEGEVSAPAEDFTHERSVVDTWERLEEDVSDVIYDIGFHLGDYSPSDFKEKGDSVQDRVRDIVRRAKKLAERDR